MAKSPKTAQKQEASGATKGFIELGSTGLKRMGGVINEEFLVELKGIRGIKTYREMESNDPIVGAVLFAIEMLIRQVEWRVDPADDSPEALEQAEFFETVKDDMSSSWVDTISEMLSFLIFGWSFHEIVYKRRAGPDGEAKSKNDDGKIGWKKLPIRAQDTLQKWIFTETGGIEAMEQRDPQKGHQVVIPLEKALLFRTSIDKGSPEGRSILRRAYRPWFFKKKIETIEAIGIERDLAGLPVAYVPISIITSQEPEDVLVYDAMKKLVTNIRRDEQEGIIFPGSRDEDGNLLFELKLMTTGGRRQFDTDKILQRYSRWIAMTVLADFILVGHEKVGSFSLASSKTAMFSTALGAFLDEIAEVFNTHGIPRLFMLNGIRRELWPTLAHGDIEDIDLGELGEFIAKMTASGFDLSDAEDFIRVRAGFPEKIDMGEDGADGNEPEPEPEPEIPGGGQPPSDGTDDLTG